MNIAKSKVKKCIREAIEVTSIEKLKCCGFYIIEDKIHHYIHCEGQTLDENIYNGEYDYLSDYDDIIRIYNQKKCKLKDIDEKVFDKIQEMINKKEKYDTTVAMFIKSVKEINNKKLQICKFNNEVKKLYRKYIGNFKKWSEFYEVDITEYKSHTYDLEEINLFLKVDFELIKENKENLLKSIIKMHDIKIF
ncbi:TPA: hypothetical protein ACMU2U_001426 [Clostridioides difficile]|nr:hypothetical protein [Clostridioides difficile]MCI4304782.1 hypothetical protein [Clostridioides difficile]MCM4101586.1 hypothetical protein [Clostridioides difficile]HBG2405032.1 hypothetical protein [Clostridioides difficile]HDF4164016.1 hypothetical protein [Clostridioides difficile]